MKQAIRQAWQTIRREYLGLAMATLMSSIVLAYLFWTGYEDAIEKAETAANGSSRLYAANIRAQLGAADGLLSDLVKQARLQTGSDAELAEFWREERTHIDSFLAFNRAYERVSLVASDGRMLFVAGGLQPPGRQNISQMDFFTALREHPERGLYISAPHRSSVSGREVMVLGRALRAPSGRFLGAVIVPFDIGDLEQLLSSVDVGGNGVVLVRRSDDSSLIARVPPAPHAKNKPMPKHPIQSRLDAGASSGVMTYLSPIDGQERIHSFQRIDGYPLYVIVGLATRDVLASWYQRLIVSLVLAALAFISLAMLYRRLLQANRRLKDAANETRKFEMAVAQSPVSIIITDRDGRIEYANPAFSRTSGYALHEVLGETPRLLKSGETSDAEYAALWKAITGGQSWSGVFRNRRRSGDTYWESAQISPLFDADGQVINFLGVKQDITEQKRVEAELEQYRSHLEELVSERTRQIGILNAELEVRAHEAEDASRAKSTFLANMSHEIRTPMNAILGLTHLLQRSIQDPAQREKLDRIADAASHLLQIINDVLDFSKIEAGKLSLERVDFDLMEVLQAARSLVADKAQAKGLDLRLEVDPAVGEHLTLAGDPTRLAQALLNYLSNAVKFTQHGYVILRVRLAESGAEDLRLRFEVEDTGVGIPQDQLPRLFAAFEQGDASTTRKFGGTGLGLVIASRLAHLMDGAVGVESRQGEGSLFWLTVRFGRGGQMPLWHDAAIAADKDAKKTLAARHHLRLLLAEDDPVNQEVAMELLRETGLGVDLAGDGEAAVRMAAAHAYDLILMDMQMPGMDGLAATRAIRAIPGHEKTPILALTANAFEEDRQRCLAAGMSDHIPKPVDPDRLFATLLRWLPPEAALPPVAPTIAPVAAGVPGVLSVEQGLKAVRGKQLVYHRLLQKFDEGNADNLAAMRRALADGDLAELRRLAHSMKGAAGNLGAAGLQAAAAALEQALRDSAGVDLPALLATVTAEVERLRAAIADYQPPEEARAVSAGTTPEEAQRLFDRLEALLAADDYQAGEVLLASRQQIAELLGPLAQAIEQDIRNFDYPGALARLRAARQAEAAGR